MANFEEGRIYEFIENLYEELSRKDDGYHPSTHDVEVFKKASVEFNKSEEELKVVYDSFQSIVTGKVTDKINKLPKDKREERTMELLKNIMKNNRDLPYHELEGAASEPIKSGLDTINEEYKSIAGDIGKNGWTIPMNMGLGELDKLRGVDKNIKVYDDLFLDYYNTPKIKLITKHVNASSIGKNQKELFNNAIDAYVEGKYLLCVTVLIPVLEGVLSSFGDDKTDIRMMKVCRTNMDLTEKENKIITHLVWISFFNFISSLYEKSHFDKDEPTILNRHWILHGRTNTEWKAEDCLRLFNAVHSLVTMMAFDK
ncbi:hypothetical protein G9F71_008760 [Clostridium sp. FP2]|uniref:hypothetical protein n=1 Tax=Clostridium sp. FP2 TaxID=2724481 RepID=UPI0013E93D3B|nr:hypothetical protein [Clostridium sp. FP2]MBZ9622944.1 hypothetical protein [Clostridium sp. FP2]